MTIIQRPRQMEVPLNIVNLFTATVFISLVFSSSTYPAEIDQVVSEAAQPVMQQYGLPGMAIGIVQNGQSHIFNYGVASKKTGKAVDDNTLFEIGSVSKTFTA